ncbi:hypothetical protein [Legionella worsleiensis]|uniref:Cofactor-independent phosphoglycerate mutase n=1 Tax=Legionella worsleiensis TaxID=45076 RepID=A0A0W1A687_9GAMM|nr:hypothetical protein [Legionella worsleiensis]KTD76862.1 hypothetical protein Lwor_2087 [Legionella worsleiensis]STY33469.1 Uncharacterized protein conserved in bacteria [Legionella worsleiensis]
MDIIINANCARVPADVIPLQFMPEASLNLLACLGYDSANLPLAQLLARMYGLDGSWVVLSPIHWQATHNDAMIITAGSELQLSDEESRDAFQQLADYLKVDGLTLHYHNAFTWLMNVSDKPCLHAKPVYCLQGHSLMPELAQLDTTMYWQRFFTECQMFFASLAHPTLLNGVWAWSGGSLSSRKSTSICADESFYPMAQACSTNVTLYSPSACLSKEQILLVNAIDVLGVQHRAEVNTYSASWYWLNSAYAIKKYNWFTRIWRSLTHAH